jgi:short-subunit dehydrogenase
VKPRKAFNIAEALAYKGSDLVLVSRNAERLEEAVGKVRAIGRRAVAVAADVADDDAPERIVEAALGLGGRIDVLVNNAGFMTFAHPFNVNDETWDEIFNVNVRAPMRITRAVLAEMIKAGRAASSTSEARGRHGRPFSTRTEAEWTIARPRPPCMR